MRATIIASNLLLTPLEEYPGFVLAGGGNAGASKGENITALRIVRERPPVEGPRGDERALLRHQALAMLVTEVSPSLGDEAYRELLAE